MKLGRIPGFSFLLLTILSPKLGQPSRFPVKQLLEKYSHEQSPYGTLFAQPSACSVALNTRSSDPGACVAFAETNMFLLILPVGS